MLARLEDFAAVGALTLEHAARIVQPVGEDVHTGVLPRHQLAVEPDDPLKSVVRLRSHHSSPWVGPNRRSWLAALKSLSLIASNTLRRSPSPGMKGPIR